MTLSHKSNKLFSIYRLSVLGLKTMWPIKHRNHTHHTSSKSHMWLEQMWLRKFMVSFLHDPSKLWILFGANSLGRLIRTKSGRGRNGWLAVTWKVGHEWMCLLPQYGSRAKMCDVHSMMTALTRPSVLISLFQGHALFPARTGHRWINGVHNSSWGSSASAGRKDPSRSERRCLS